MRTTLDLPDELFRQLKSKAALEGVTLKDLLTTYITRCLGETPAAAPQRTDRSEIPVPERWRHGGPPIRSLSNAELQEIFDEEDFGELWGKPRD